MRQAFVQVAAICRDLPCWQAGEVQTCCLNLGAGTNTQTRARGLTIAMTAAVAEAITVAIAVPVTTPVTLTVATSVAEAMTIAVAQL